MITGGAGFIGSHLLRLFVTKYPEYRIVNLDALTYAGNLENLRDVEAFRTIFSKKGDITDQEGIQNLFEKYSFDAVIPCSRKSCGQVYRRSTRICRKNVRYMHFT